MNDVLVVITALVALMVAVGLLIGIIFSAVQYPGRWLCGLVLLVLIISCQRADAAVSYGQDSLKAAPLGCMLAAALPLPQTGMAGGAAAFVPAGTSGGGSFDWLTWLALGIFVLLVYGVRLREVENRKLRELVLELEAFKPPPFALVDIVGNPTPDVDDEARKRYLHIEFTSLGGLVEFNTWLHNARYRYKREGWPAVEP